MGLFDFSKEKNNKPSIDLTDFNFTSDDHTRIENGRPTNANNKGSWRSFRIKSSDNIIFYVTMYNLNGNHPVWGNNIQMAEKRMKLVTEQNEKIILRGFGTDEMGYSFADYGLTLHKLNSIVNKVTLHMHDRNIDIVYTKAEDKIQSENLNEMSDFENFQIFIQKWNSGMPIEEKVQIAIKSDALCLEGVFAYNNDDYQNAIQYFEQAIEIMPNNDDALKNLKLCYSETGNQAKLNEIVKKLNYLT